MKKIMILFSAMAMILIMASEKGSAQIINGAFRRQDVYQRKPMQLPSVREADVFWSKMVWRIIDLREKMNQTLYFPTTEIENRKNFVSLLLEGIETEKITAYDARFDDDFKLPITFEEVRSQFGAETRTERVQDIETGEVEERIVEGEVRTDEVKRLMIKEEWYFDKQNSKLDVRIIGICPIREYVREDDPSGQIQRTQLFWVYYPEIRELLSTHEVFNPDNDGQRMTFDDLFVKRFFNSYITKESNRFNNRAISQYLTGKEAMYESRRIEQEIFDFEQDLWEY
jgi:gliding motility associated protien GldN